MKRFKREVFLGFASRIDVKVTFLAFSSKIYTTNEGPPEASTFVLSAIRWVKDIPINTELMFLTVHWSALFDNQHVRYQGINGKSTIIYFYLISLL